MDEDPKYNLKVKMKYKLIYYTSAMILIYKTYLVRQRGFCKASWVNRNISALNMIKYITHKCVE